MIKTYLNAEKQAFLSTDSCLPRVEFITRVSDSPNFIYSSHRHTDRCEVALIVNGQGHYIINNVPYTASPGDIVVFDQGIVHFEQTDSAKPLEKWVCAIKDLKLAGRETNHVLIPNALPILHMGEKAKLLESCFEIIFDACTNPTHHSFEKCQHAICIILASIDEEMHALPVVNNTSKEKNLVQNIIDYIDVYFAEPITLESLSAQYFISPDHLSHIVKKEIGISPINYLISRRIGESQRLLLNTLLPISTIATLVGYPNVNHFSNAFKKKLGISPGQFRTNYNIINYVKSDST